MLEKKHYVDYETTILYRETSQFSFNPKQQQSSELQDDSEIEKYNGNQHSQKRV